MNHQEYLMYSSEVKDLEGLLAETPDENVIERIGLEERLKNAKSAIKNVQEHLLVHKARLTFKGKPVYGSHGIAADFAAKAAASFSDAVSAVAAGLAENLHYMGPIPDKQKNQLLITGTAIGSFGFEFELPEPDNTLFPIQSDAENALDKMEELFRLATLGSDDELAEVVTEIHPRAVKKAAEFLAYIAQQDALCSLEFKERRFQYEDIDQLQHSKKRLQEDNILESEELFSGKMVGVLPLGRSFELILDGDKQRVIRGKIGSDIEDPDILNRDFLQKNIKITLQVIQVGQGRPRFTMQSLPQLIE